MANEHLYRLREPSHAVSVERIAHTVQMAATGPVFTPAEARTVCAAMIEEARGVETRRD